MVVRFKCPNGHILSASEALVGKPGKCPQCQASFVVPAKVEVQDADSRPNSGVSTGSGVTPGSGPISVASGGSAPKANGAPPAGEVFVFLCPNGHRLNGPPSLKGKPGKCPHCQATFLIPVDEIEETIVEEAEYEEDSGSQPEPPFPADIHPLGHIVARLWHHKGEQGEIELFLPEGEILSPEHYSSTLSQRDYGVFATREGEAYQFTVIPWTAVRRVAVHRVEELPPGLFE